ncbi:MAG: glycosyltransferase [Rhodobacteraceae bacterium]|nr:glycosyltransferase [Paracoccaceae bacterium]
MGRPVRSLRLPGGFPAPSAWEVATTGRVLAALSPEVPAILDGFVVGALEPIEFARLRAPFVAMIHHPLALETGLAPDRAAWLRRTERANLQRAAHVVVPSPRTREDLIRSFGVPETKISVALPGVPKPLGPRAPVEPPLILSVGTLVPRKGHDVLLEALARLVDLPWQAVIAGAPRDPATAAALVAQSARLGLSERVQFRGEISEAELSHLYRSAAVFALASRLEGYGMVFAEALSHGLPIVTCRNSAIPDTVPDAAGALVPTDDAQAFAGALRQLMTEPEARTRAEAGAQIAGAKLPRWADTATVMAEALDRVAPGNAPSLASE